MLSREEQFAKVLYPMFVTPLGMDTLLREEQFSKMPEPISVTPFGIIRVSSFPSYFFKIPSYRVNSVI